MKPILFRVKEEIINGINYRLDNDNQIAVVIEKSGGYEGDIIIPETVVFNEATYRVTTIGARAFQTCTSLSSITIPNSVTSIEAWHSQIADLLHPLPSPTASQVLDLGLLMAAPL